MFNELDPSGTNLDPDNKDAISFETASYCEFCSTSQCPLLKDSPECQEQLRIFDMKK